MPAGNYVQTRLTWYTPTFSTNEDNGERIEEHTANGYLWASVLEIGGRNGTDVGGVQTGVEVEIRIRNYPAVQPLDLLTDPYQEYTYHVETVYNGDDEIIVTGYRNDTLEDFTIAESS